MSEIERLAAVLQELRSDYPEWNTPAIKARAEREVRAILLAMREPSEGVIDAGGSVEFQGHDMCELETDSADEAAGPIWQAMIDHILSEA